MIIFVFYIVMFKFCFTYFIFYCISWCVESSFIENNAYKGVSISFSQEIQEKTVDFRKLKEVLQKSSEILFHATRKRSYFEEFIFNIPSSWADNMCSQFAKESPNSIDILFTQADDRVLESHIFKAQHSKGCGQQGDVLYVSSDWYQGEVEELARKFLQQWSIYRYGVFEEDPVDFGACFSLTSNEFSPVGCYNIRVDAEPTFNNGIPICYLNESSFDGEFNSSLMFTNGLSKASDFCDGSIEYPHHPSMPTVHNNLCGGQTVWSVIENSDDFKYGRNLPIISALPRTKFKCFQEQPIRVTFAIQNNTVSKDLTEAMQELGPALQLFLLHIAPQKMAANVIMFSDDDHISQSVELDLTNESKLEAQLRNTLKTFDPISKTCLNCGLRKALQVSRQYHPHPQIVVLIAWESVLLGENTDQLVDTIRQFAELGVQLPVILFEDTEKEVLSSNLVNAIRATGGLVYYLQQEYVLMASKLQGVLADIVKQPLQIHNDVSVIHERLYSNITDSFDDSFNALNGMTGNILYIIHCTPIQMVEQNEQSCHYIRTVKLDRYQCSKSLEETSSDSRWTFSFTFKGGTTRPTCSSVALLQTTSQNRVHLRGWLNEYAITPGENALVVYAEMSGALKIRFQVKAHILGPEKFEHIMELRDNGNGDPDTKKDDGIYSRYFSPLVLKKGSYSVSIVAENVKDVESFSFSDTISEGSFKQSKSLGFFSVVQSSSGSDIYPPNRVADLKAIAIHHENRTVTLQWTAPGNDYDSGTATSYEIKHSNNPANLLPRYFNNEHEVSLESKTKPKENGQREIMTIYLSDLNEQTFYVGLRAMDAKRNKGKISNVIQIYFKNPTVVTENNTSSNESTTVPSTASDFTESGENTTENSEVTDAILTNFTITIEKPIFDDNFIIFVSSTGSILFLIVILNIIICICCIKRRSKHQKPPSRKESLRPPYNMNIAFQDDSVSHNEAEKDLGISISMSSLVERASDLVYSEPPVKTKAIQQPHRYSYHTNRSLSNKRNSEGDSELGFRLVQTLPAYATSSLSRYTSGLNDENDSHTTERSSKATHVYSLGRV